MKKFRIKDVSELLGISTYTLRYYEKIGLLKFVKRDENGIREFEPNDLIVISTIIYLRKTGMRLKEIKKYLKLAENGIDTVEQRKEMFLKQKQKVISENIGWKRKSAITALKVHYYT